MEQHQHCIVTVDARRAAFYAVDRSPGAGAQLKHLGSIENSHEAEHEHHRPALLGGSERGSSTSRSGAHAGRHPLAEGHAAEEETLRFTREVGQWLTRVKAEFGARRVTVFAPPRCLGLLRKELGAWREVPELLEAELTHLRPPELAAHPAVLKVIGPR